MAEDYARRAVYEFGYRRSPDQDAKPPAAHPVVVVGAGPVGLTAAIRLAQRGVRVVLLDDADRIGEGSRGLCYSKPCLEILDRAGVGRAVIDKGVGWKLGKVFFRDDLVFQFDLLPEDGHKMPAFVNLQQYYLEKYLVERVAATDAIDLRWSNRVVALARHPDHVRLTVETPEGPYAIDGQWLIAADGARSSLREMLGLDFVGETFRDKFLIADVRMAADYPAERWFWFEPPFHGGQSTLLHKQPDDVWRIDFQIGWDADAEEEKRPERVLPRLEKMLQGRDFTLEWVSVYTFQCRRLERFVHGRVLFAGDAAHQVSPFGARGANSGIEDADNLAWKLALVVKGEAPAALLDSYDCERVEAADQNLAHSTRSTDFIVPKSPGAEDLRNATLALARDLPFARAMVNSGRLHTAARYRSPLSTPDRTPFAGRAAPGTRMPDAPLVGANGEPGWLIDAVGDGFTLIHVANGAAPNVPEGIDLVTIGGEWTDATGQFAKRYDATPGACWLIRPDHYVAARLREFDRAGIEAALARATGRA